MTHQPMRTYVLFALSTYVVFALKFILVFTMCTWLQLAIRPLPLLDRHPHHH
jgi:hypothetical protein